MDFRNTLIILTSNLGAEFIAQDAGDDLSQKTRDAVMGAVREHFRPEFLNRLDEMLIFRRLSRQNMTKIVDVQLQHLRKLLEDRKITLEVSGSVLEWLAMAGFDPVYGARPLKRVIQRTLQNPLAQEILSGKILDGQTVVVSTGHDGLVIEPKKAAAA